MRTMTSMLKVGSIICIAIAVLAPSVAPAAAFLSAKTQWNKDAFSTASEEVEGVTTYTYTWHDARNWRYQHTDNIWYRGDEVITDLGEAVGWMGEFQKHRFGLRFDEAFNTIGANTRININITQYVDNTGNDYGYPKWSGAKDANGIPRITIIMSDTGSYTQSPQWNDIPSYDAINLDIAGNWNTGAGIHVGTAFSADTHITLRGEGIFNYRTNRQSGRDALWAGIEAGRFIGVDGAGIAGTHIASLIEGTGKTAEELIADGRLVEDYNDSGIGVLALSGTIPGTGDEDTRHAFFAAIELPPGMLLLLR